MPEIVQNVHINAPVEKVYAVARDVEAFPQYMDDLQSLTVLERSEDNKRTVTAWVGIIREFKMNIKWTQEDVWDDSAHTDVFKMIQGDMDSMSGVWRFIPEEGGTRFESEVSYEFDVPLIGPMVKNLIRKKMTENLQATMQAIKGCAERAE